jgi:hypothetical protein
VPPPPALKATVTEKNRGRIERRTLESTSILTVTSQWPGLQQGFRLTREITTRGKTTVEVVHGITSLPPASATAAVLLAKVRDHWQVENQLHYVRDVTLGEDACRVRSGAAPQALAACRNAALCLFGRVSTASQLETVQYLAARPDEALDLLLSQE